MGLVVKVEVVGWLVRGGVGWVVGWGGGVVGSDRVSDVVGSG